MIYGICCPGQGFEWSGTPEPLQGWGESYVTVPPPVEPLTLDEVKLYHRIDQDVEDTEITRWIKSARQYVEEYLGSSLVTQTRAINLQQYYDGMRLPYGPVQSIVSASTTSPYLIEYVAGYPPVISEETDYVVNIPEPIRTAMQLLIGDLYEHRENVVLGTPPATLQFALEAHLEFYRYRRGFA